MTESKEYNIKVIVTDITVDESYWDIAFEIYVNGELKSAGGCGDDHDWGEDYKKFEKVLLKNPLPYIMESMDGGWD